MPNQYTQDPPEDHLYKRFNERTYFSNNGCIETTWRKTQRGSHTLVKYLNKHHQAHRLSWELYVGNIPIKMQVNHLCNNPRCVNVLHLYIGTQRQNMQDMSRAHILRKQNF